MGGVEVLNKVVRKGLPEMVTFEWLEGSKPCLYLRRQLSGNTANTEALRHGYIWLIRGRAQKISVVAPAMPALQQAFKSNVLKEWIMAVWVLFKGDTKINKWLFKAVFIKLCSSGLPHVYVKKINKHWCAHL